MKLSQLNEDAILSVSDKGLEVYLNPQEKTFTIQKNEKTKELRKRGMVTTIRTADNYKKLKDMGYKPNPGDVKDIEEWIEIHNTVHDANKEKEFRVALAKMNMDMWDSLPSKKER